MLINATIKWVLRRKFASSSILCLCLLTKPRPPSLPPPPPPHPPLAPPIGCEVLVLFPISPLHGLCGREPSTVAAARSIMMGIWKLDHRRQTLSIFLSASPPLWESCNTSSHGELCSWSPCCANQGSRKNTVWWWWRWRWWCWWWWWYRMWLNRNFQLSSSISIYLFITFWDFT